MSNAAAAPFDPEDGDARASHEASPESAVADSSVSPTPPAAAEPVSDDPILQSGESLSFFAERRFGELCAICGGPPLMFRPKARGEGVEVALNERLVVAIFAEERLIFRDPELKRFFVYEEETGTWDSITGKGLPHELHALLQRLAKSEGLPKFETVQLGRDRTITPLLKWLEGEVENRDAFSNKLPLVHASNGMVVLGEKGYLFTDYHPSYYSRHRLPIAYQRDAKCPRFKRFLNAALPNAADRYLLKVLFGQWLLGKNLTQTILIIVGEGGTGKGTLLDMLTAFIGDGNIAEIRSGQLGSRFELSSFVDKTLLMGADVDENFLSKTSASALKKMTGGDRITVEFKYANERRFFKGTFNMVIPTNCQLRLKLQGDASAWRRRLVKLRFADQKIESPNPTLAEDILAAEGPGILNWGLEGLAILLHRLGRKLEGLPLTDRHRDTVDQLIDGSDSLNGFLRVCIRKEKDAVVTSAELLEAYKSYCAKNGYPEVPSAFKDLNGLVTKRFNVAQCRDKTAECSVRRYKHIALNQEEIS